MNPLVNLLGKRRYMMLRAKLLGIKYEQTVWPELPDAITLTRDIRHYKSEKDFATVEQIRDEILRAGISESIRLTIPFELLKFTGGLNIWHIPIQLAKAMHLVIQQKPSSYLEIGTNRGGNFMFWTEVLRICCDHFSLSVGVDIAPSITLNHYVAENKEVRMIYGDSMNLPDLLKRNSIEPTFDLVYIDGNHNDAYVRKDFEHALKFDARVIMFHDIQDAGCPDVVAFWNEVKNSKPEFDYYEFLDAEEDENPRTF